MALVSPLASSANTPGLQQIADDLSTSKHAVIGTLTAYAIGFGIGPLILAPLSETSGRRIVYMICFGCFALLQIPAALARNVEMLIVVRALAGFFGSVGIASGGGTISDMFDASERARVLGWYMFGIMIGPSIGPLFGGITVDKLGWRWVFWFLSIVAALMWCLAFFFLRESYAPILLSRRKQELEKKHDNMKGKFEIEGLHEGPLWRRMAKSCTRPIKILTQPIVLIMSSYQALITGVTFVLFTSFQDIYTNEYGFTTTQVGLVYLARGLGLLSAVLLLSPQIDHIYNKLKSKNDDIGKPEFRLPIANIGAILVPISLFCFAWSIQYHAHWAISISATFILGVGQVAIFTPVQNYYIDSFEKYAASATAASALFRSLAGGIVPLVTAPLLKYIGYGWGFSVFGLAALILGPAPILFYVYGARIRERFTIDL